MAKTSKSEEMLENPRVLTIQSHVVHGYVGNKSATFPLQVLGFEVDAINSVQFSNHTGYKKFAGQILTDKDLAGLYDCLKVNDLDHYTHVLTGYVGNSTFLTKVGHVVSELKANNKNLIYVCDPVMGDNGEMYVPKELLPIYQEDIVPLADILTPNQFEAELLTGTKIRNVDDAWNAVEMLHGKGCQTVVLSSTDLGDGDHLLALASTRKGPVHQKAIIKIPKLPARFTGTGDLFSSLLLAWMHKTDNDIRSSLEKTIATMQCILQRTIRYASAVGKCVTSLELKLIQSKQDIELPSVDIRAEVL